MELQHPEDDNNNNNDCSPGVRWSKVGLSFQQVLR
jgi:hypothetical protein